MEILNILNESKTWFWGEDWQEANIDVAYAILFKSHVLKTDDGATHYRQMKVDATKASEHLRKIREEHNRIVDSCKKSLEQAYDMLEKQKALMVGMEAELKQLKATMGAMRGGNHETSRRQKAD